MSEEILKALTEITAGNTNILRNFGNKKHSPSEFPVGNLQCDGHYGPCPNHNAARQRQNTRYEDDKMNWVTLCPECAAANADDWDEQWAEYYGGLL